MANEITYAVSLAASKGGASISSGTLSDTVSMTGSDMQSGTQTIEYHASTAEVLSYNSTDITGNCHFVIKNLDATYSVKVSTLATFDADSIMSILAPGEAASFRGIAANKIFLVATTDPGSDPDPVIQYWICEV